MQSQNLGEKNSISTLYGLSMNLRETIVKPYLFIIRFDIVNHKIIDSINNICG